MKLLAEDSDDVTVDGGVLAEGDGADEVVVKADELLLEVHRTIVEPEKEKQDGTMKVYN